MPRQAPEEYANQHSTYRELPTVPPGAPSLGPHIERHDCTEANPLERVGRMPSTSEDLKHDSEVRRSQV